MRWYIAILVGVFSFSLFFSPQWLTDANFPRVTSVPVALADGDKDDDDDDDGKRRGKRERRVVRALAQCTADLGTCATDLGTCATNLAACQPQANFAPVPQTGQTTTYAGGDDGELQAGVPPPNPRFTDNLDGTVTDNRSGLIWLKNANCPNAGRSWQEALDDVQQLNTNGTMNGNACGDTGGNMDWRLPNRFELESLLNLENPDGKPNGDPFMGTMVLDHWTSTTFAGNTTHAWQVGFDDGAVGHFLKSTPENARVLASIPIPLPSPKNPPTSLCSNSQASISLDALDVRWER